MICKMNSVYNEWLEKVTQPDLKAELEEIKDCEKAISDRFYQTLAFGTGGLRGVIGVGTNRMNVHIIGLATQALSNWLCSKGGEKSVAIGYDSRNKSDEFAKAAAATLAANGIKAYIFSEMQPTPILSFALMEKKCDAGIVVTASHNPAEYNGFKCYGPEGYQMTDEDATSIEHIMSGLDIFADVKTGDFDSFVELGMIEYMGSEIVDKFLDAVQSCCIEKDICAATDLSVVYTPLRGTGEKPVQSILARLGIRNVTVVSEQCGNPGGKFEGCEYPNPEIEDAFRAANEVAAKMDKKPDLLLATDPDCDRVGIAVWNGTSFERMTGNEVGVVMLDYLLSRKTAPEGKSLIAVKSIVTSSMAERVAKKYNCDFRNVLTGFKYIGEIMCELAKSGEDDLFVMGYEESYGYLEGTHARDKDAVVGSMLICEMAAFYKAQGKTLLQRMEELYNEFGRHMHTQYSPSYKGQEGMERIASIMNTLRSVPPCEIAGQKVVTFNDYLNSVSRSGDTETKIDLPSSNVLEFIMEDASSLVARPSGTEPKIKFYLTAVCDSQQACEDKIAQLGDFAKELAPKL